MTHKPEGLVSRAASELVLHAPAQLDDQRWSLLVTHLKLLRPRVHEEERVIFIEAERVQQLRAQLSLWPASAINWRWEEQAELAHESSAADVDRLSSVVSSNPTEQAEWPEGVDLGAAGFVRTLRDFQVRDVARLLYMGNGANFSVPGAGKTTTAYAVFAALRQRREVDGMLVVAPTSAFEAWVIEARECFLPGLQPVVAIGAPPPPGASVLVLNYERLEQRRVLAEIDRWLGTRRTLVVFDEAHRAKAGKAGLRGRLCRALAERAHRRLVLTGTPMPNRPSDLAAVFDLVWPGHGARLTGGDLAAVRERAYVRARKSELALPELDFRVEHVELEAAHRRLYDAVSGQAIRALEDPRLTADVLERAIIRLIGVASNPAAILTPEEPLALPSDESFATINELLRDPSSHVRPAKLIRAAQLVRENAARGRKTLVWSNFVRNVTALAELLAPYGPAVIVGDTPQEDARAETDRAREIARFRNDPSCQVLVATPQTLGEGVSLHQVCIDQIHVDRGFAAGTFLQAMDRTHRLGMGADARPSCTVLVARDTVDERVEALLSAKISAFANALSDSALLKLTGLEWNTDVSLRDSFLEEGDRPHLRKLLGPLLRARTQDQAVSDGCRWRR